jgi:nucleotidyltransferase substrate binding protein (TIGR01987 family)
VPCLSPNRRILCTIQAINPLIAPVQISRAASLHLRAGAIQAFEFTYELSIKILRLYIETIASNDQYANSLTFNELIRSGYEEGLLNAELVQWKDFRSDRGTTSHSYNEVKAQIIYEAIPVFLEEAKFLAEQLKSRLATQA